jgi:hypothetical protein
VQILCTQVLLFFRFVLTKLQPAVADAVDPA